VNVGTRERASRRTMRRATAGVAATPDARRTRNGCRAYAGRHPGEGRPKLFQRCPAPARAQRRTMKNATEKRASATGQAVETPEGGRHLMRTTNVSRHRRAASRSGGAMSAECDGRPCFGELTGENPPKAAASGQRSEHIAFHFEQGTSPLAGSVEVTWVEDLGQAAAAVSGSAARARQSLLGDHLPVLNTSSRTPRYGSMS
jgi:hypothetical protein